VKIIKKILFLSLPVLLIAMTCLLAGCASTKHTEQMLSEAGFRQIGATTDKQIQHLKSMPADKLTVATLNGKKFYVFPDPAHNQIFVGNLEEYQTYQQILTYSKIEGQNRVYADEGQASGADDSDKWVEWTNNTGWTHGSD
jgi:hypothetical protein